MLLYKCNKGKLNKSDERCKFSNAQLEARTAAHCGMLVAGGVVTQKILFPITTIIREIAHVIYS